MPLDEQQDYEFPPIFFTTSEGFLFMLEDWNFTAVSASVSDEGSQIDPILGKSNEN